MSLANQLSIFRILLVPAFVACLMYYQPGESEYLRQLAVGLFILAALTDAIDGYVARVSKQATKLGSILDPAADKLFMVTAFLCLALVPTLPEQYHVPHWVPILVISRDILIVLGYLLVMFMNGEVEAKPSLIGKITTASQMVVIPCILLGLSFAKPVLWISMAFTVVSGIDYLITANRLLNTSPEAE